MSAGWLSRLAAIAAIGVSVGVALAGTQTAAAPTDAVDTVIDTAVVGGRAACRLGPPGTECGAPWPTVPPALPGCPDDPRAAVVDKAAQRFWLCADGLPITDARPMTTGSEEYGLPPVGTHYVFARNAIATGIHGETLHRFVAFYRTPRYNRIAFHQYVHQPESTVGDLARRGESSGCLRVTTADSWLVWDFLEIGDPVVVITA